MSVYFFTMKNLKHRAVIEFFVKKDLKAMEIHTEIVNVLGESGTSKIMVCKWAGEIKRGRTSIEVDQRSGRPKDVSTSEVMEQICVIVSEVPSATTRAISDERVRHVLHEE